MTAFTSAIARNSTAPRAGLQRRSLALVLGAALMLGAGSAQASWWGNSQRIEGSGTAATVTRAATGFDQISLGGSWKVVLRQGSTEGVVIEADDNLMAYIETAVVGRALSVGTRSGTYIESKSPMKVTINFIKLNALNIGGSYHIEGGAIKTDRLTVNMGGTGKLHINSLEGKDLVVNLGGSGNVQIEGVAVEQASVNVGGSGNVRLSGRAPTQAFSVGGSGNVRASELEGQTVSVSVAGSGNVHANARRSLNVTVAGSGNVRYSGEGTVNQTVRGSGSVSKL